MLKSPSISSLLYTSSSGSSDEGVLPAITVLRKLCNHPQLLLGGPAGAAGAKGGAAGAGEGAGGGGGGGSCSGAAEAALAALQKEAAGQALDLVELSGGWVWWH